MIEIGDRVKFLNETGGGVVRGFVDRTTVNVEDETGFEIPMPISELVKIDDLEKAGADHNGGANVSTIQETYLKEKDTASFFFAFVPGDLSNLMHHAMEIFLVNDCNYHLLYNISHYKDDTFYHVCSGTMKPNTKKSIESLGVSELRDLPEFHVQLIYFQQESEKLETPLQKRIKVTSLKLSKRQSYSKSNFFESDVYLIPLIDSVMDQKINQLLEKVNYKDSEEKHSSEAIHSIEPTKEIIEVDLHINQLVDSISGLSKHELLEIQVDRFHNEMEAAIKSKARRIVFIHGVGNGKLKGEIVKELKSKYSRFYFQDASFKEYGYGATMVILRKY